MTLNGEGNTDAAFIFQIDSTLTTASNSNIELINDAVFCRVFWKVGSSATLGTDSNFKGHILAQESITANNGATVQGQLLARDGAVTLDNNTITNGFCTSTLTIIKEVINDDGRTAVASDFNIHVKKSGDHVSGSPASGSGSPGITYTLAPGTYVVSEGAFEGYTATYSGDSDSNGVITLEAGDNKTVTIINNDMPITTSPTPSPSPSATPAPSSTPLPTPAPAPSKATLRVIKHVINDDGRTAVASDFNVHVKNSTGNDVNRSPAPGAESPGKFYVLTPGTYTISEDASEGYTVSYGGDSDSGGNITLAAGDVKTVVITNNDIPMTPLPTPTPSKATLYVIKQVINDDGRTAMASDFNIHLKTSSGDDVNGSPFSGVEAPGASYILDPGNYVISEESSEWYTSNYGGDCDSEGNITLVAGDVKTVVITNNDMPINPQTGNFFDGNPWIGLLTAATGGFLILLGIYLYLNSKRKRKNVTNK